MMMMFYCISLLNLLGFIQQRSIDLITTEQTDYKHEDKHCINSVLQTI